MTATPPDSPAPDPADGGPAPAPLDRATIERLWRENRRWIAAVLLAHKPADSDLEDLLQEVAMTLVAKGHAIRDEAAARGWLRTVAVNVARVAARRRASRRDDRTVPLDDAPGLAARDGSHDPAAATMERELQQRLAALPEAYREPLMLRAVRGLPASVIGETLGLGEAAVNTRLARARRMLRGTWPSRPPAPPGPDGAAAPPPSITAPVPAREPSP